MTPLQSGTWRMRDGRLAVVAVFDWPNEGYTIFGTIEDSGSDKWHADGGVFGPNGEDSEMDLIEFVSPENAW